MAISHPVEFCRKVWVRRRFRLACILTGATLFVMSGCAPPDGQAPAVQTSLRDQPSEIPLEPDTVLSLPAILREVSGLSVTPAGVVLALQDELAMLFALNTETGEVGHTVRFGGNGDFEALTVVGGHAYALRSDARLFRTQLPSESAGRAPAARWSIPLHRGCDAESLDYEEAKGVFWLICKERPGSKIKTGRGVYSFPPPDLNSSKGTVVARLQLVLEPPPGVSLDHFNPADLTFLPDGSGFMVVSTRRPALYRYSMDGISTGVWTLPESLLPQPEGVAIDRMGRLLIASEGPGKRGTLAIFNAIPD